MASLYDSGLRVVEVSDVHAMRAELDRPTVDPPHVLRLQAAGRDWDELRDLGLTIRPTWIHWVCPIVTGSADLIKRQSGNQGRRSRNVIKYMESLTQEVCDPLTADAFDEWVELYEAQLANMSHGLNLAARFRAGLLADDSEYALVAWRRGDRMVCGSVVRYDRERNALVGRFGAVATDERTHDLTRGMYLGLADFAAGRALRWLSLGNDPNFYGALVMPGLCAYKLRLGFAPVPGDLFGNSGTVAVAEAVTNLYGLELPVLMFEYRGTLSSDATIDNFVDGSQALGLVSVTTADDAGETITSLPPHRRVFIGESSTGS